MLRLNMEFHVEVRLILKVHVTVLFLYHAFLTCFASVSSPIKDATDVNALFNSALLLSALPVPLLRQVPLGGLKW